MTHNYYQLILTKYRNEEENIDGLLKAILSIGDEIGLERALGYLDRCGDNGDCLYFSCQEDAHGRRVRDMTIREIENELEKIYRERKSWNGAKGPFTEPVIRLEELILIKQQILYRMEDAKLLKDKREESFNSTLYRIIDSDIINLSSKGNKI